MNLISLTSAADPLSVAALQLYSAHTPRYLRETSNLISYWIERADRMLGAKLFFLGIVTKGVVDGYAQAAYLRETSTLFLSHLAISPTRRSMQAVKDFGNALNHFVLNRGLTPSRMASDIALGSDSDSASYSWKLMRLGSMLRIAAAHAPYRKIMAVRGSDLLYSPGRMLVSDIAKERSISAGEYLDLVNDIYTAYYAPWIAPMGGSSGDIAVHFQEIAQEIKGAAIRLGFC